MSNSEGRQRGRDEETQKRILTLRTEIEQMAIGSDEQVRRIFFVISHILSILSSENGTVMRILDKQDEINRRLFDERSPEDGSLVERVDKVFAVYKSLRKVLIGLLAAFLILVMTKYYESIKLNEIIANQKNPPVQTTKP